MNNKTKIKPSLKLLLERNEKFAKQYKQNALMKLINSKEITQKSKRIKLLDGIQVFSNYFQKAIMLRHILCDDSRFYSVTHDHLTEEFNHNVSLLKDRNHRPPVWDAILEATAAWFSWKMLTLGEEEKTVLVHLVLEASANIFFQAAHKVMMTYSETNYFEIHAKLDEEHEKMGRDLLKGLSSEKYKRLLEIQEQGWNMLNSVCERIAICTHSSLDCKSLLF